ncbi:carboxylesterase/lipase family protein [Streptomyces sp. AV19]|uniref:carboxylesterase/lipase family protein n=1 Tax=Streptomyces sp. AV19 TaxID=2793068 RepID=UPI0018FED59A|nr:carboxylesterase family protein [Streptomyces sp. AV19]MBH1937562.1 carboxylesterase/lipase family protein [Streptomyces sp. AV19]MDG4536432.1 carboxylesterase family protein [Streptomyces sp. AV19]
MTDSGGGTRENEPVVTVPAGRLRGTTDGTVAAFRGIPYAASPVGALRFAAPRPHPGWDGERDAAVAGPSAPQGPSRLAPLMGARVPDWDEDGCLNLNVWTPAAALEDGAGPRPVLLWFHGGSFTSGSGGWDWYDGARLAALGDMVVVTANYRLGALGWLYLPEHGVGNLGSRDQAAALRWVHATIGAFGGDPSRVTVGGQSAGAHSALALAVDPATAGLVHRVLAQSGPFGLPPQDPDRAAGTARGLLGALDSPAGLEGLRALPAATLLDASARAAARAARPGEVAPAFMPVLGAAGCPRSPLDAVREGALDGRPLLIGTTTDEMTAFGPLEADGPEVFHAAGDEIALRSAAQGGDTFVYRFGRRPEPDPMGLGATHCADLPFLFGTFDAFPDAPILGPVTDADRALSGSFAGAVAAFVNGGAPWPAFDGDRRQVRDFGRAGVNQAV